MLTVHFPDVPQDPQIHPALQFKLVYIAQYHPTGIRQITTFFGAPNFTAILLTAMKEGNIEKVQATIIQHKISAKDMLKFKSKTRRGLNCIDYAEHNQPLLDWFYNRLITEKIKRNIKKLLYWAVILNQLEVVTTHYKPEHAEFQYGQNNWGLSHLAARYNRVDMLKRLLTPENMDPMRLPTPHFLISFSCKYYSPLHIAAARGHRESVLWLLENGADPNKQGVIENCCDWTNTIGFSALHTSIIEGQTDIMILLLEHGANPACKKRIIYQSHTTRVTTVQFVEKTQNPTLINTFYTWCFEHWNTLSRKVQKEIKYTCPQELKLKFKKRKHIQPHT